MVPRHHPFSGQCSDAVERGRQVRIGFASIASIKRPSSSSGISADARA
jgi:hypothetical protein